MNQTFCHQENKTVYLEMLPNTRGSVTDVCVCGFLCAGNMVCGAPEARHGLLAEETGRLMGYVCL